MPRYFFAFEGEPPDRSGEDFPDDMAALKQAEMIAQELGQSRSEPVKIEVYNSRSERVRIQ